VICGTFESAADNCGCSIRKLPKTTAAVEGGALLDRGILSKRSPLSVAPQALPPQAFPPHHMPAQHTTPQAFSAHRTTARAFSPRHTTTQRITAQRMATHHLPLHFPPQCIAHNGAALCVPLAVVHGGATLGVPRAGAEPPHLRARCRARLSTPWPLNHPWPLEGPLSKGGIGPLSRGCRGAI